MQIEEFLTYGLDYFQSTSTVVPYYPSGMSMEYHNKPSPPLPASAQLNTYNMNSTVDQNYQPYSPGHMLTVQEMDGVDRYPHELDTERIEHNHEEPDRSPAIDDMASDLESRRNRV